MDNSILLKFEIITTLISFLYIIYYYFERIYYNRLEPRLKKMLRSELVVEEIPRETVNIAQKEDFYKKFNLVKDKISKENKEKLEDIIKRVKINSSK